MQLVFETDPLVLVDGTNQVRRLWNSAAFTAGDDAAAQTLVRRVQAAAAEWRAAAVAVAFDGFAKTPLWRCQIDPLYTRGALVAANRQAADALAAAGVAVFAVPGFESRDWIATACHQAAREGARCVVVSGDASLRQVLVEGRVSIASRLFLEKANGGIGVSWLTATRVRELYAIEPAQWADFEALQSAPGIGPTTASSLLRAGGTMDAVLDQPHRFASTARIRDTLLRFRELAPIARQLATLRLDVPFDFSAFLSMGNKPMAEPLEPHPAAAADSVAADGLRVVTVRMPAGLHESLKRSAHRCCQSLNQLCVDALAARVAAGNVDAGHAHIEDGGTP